MMRRFSSSKRSALLAAEAGPAPLGGFMTSRDHEEDVEGAARQTAESIVAASGEEARVGAAVRCNCAVSIEASCRRSARIDRYSRRRCAVGCGGVDVVESQQHSTAEVPAGEGDVR